MNDLYTQVKERLSPGPARVVLMTKSGLAERMGDIAEGEAPRDFFYNFIDLVERGYDARMLNTSSSYTGLMGKISRARERAWGRLSGISQRHRLLDETRSTWQNADVIVSFTDHFSLTLGDYFRDKAHRPHTVGVFHGLCDFAPRLTRLGAAYADSYVRRCLGGLDLVCFMGPADRAESQRRYGLTDAQTELLLFGVDTEFWRSAPTNYTRETTDDQFQVLTVGSDPSRDFETLLKADVPGKLRMVTRLPVDQWIKSSDDVELIQGSYWNTQLTDTGLRRLYWDTDAVVVPLKDVYQPTGYSVALQAMACAKPIVLSNIIGLWAPDLYVDGENCILVPPGEPKALSDALERLRADANFARELGERGRRFVERHFTLRNMNESMLDAVQRFSTLQN